MKFCLFLQICIVVSFTTFSGSANAATSPGRKLFLILLDGFRWDYLETFFKPEQIPGFSKLQNNGVRARSLKPDFPSVSYVNYYSLMTGLHAENHGFVHNYMYDPETGKKFLIGENQDQYLPFWWNDAEPLWIGAERQGKRTYFWYWPGCEIEIQGRRPKFCLPYQSSANPSFGDFSNALQSAIHVLKNGSADVVGVYFEQVDHWGHEMGPKDDKVAEVISGIDSELSKTLSLLETEHFMDSGKRLADDVDIVIFADHGMTQLIDRTTGIIRFNFSLPSPSDVIIGSISGPVVQIYTAQENVQSFYDRLRGWHPNVTVYTKNEIPERFFLKRHRRVPPILLVADLGYTIVYQPNASSTSNGYHGFDNEFQDMHGIFFAYGPDFKKGKTTKTLRNVDLYQVMCHVLNIKASANNGTWADVADILEDIRISDERSRAGSECTSHSALLLLMCAVAIIYRALFGF